MLAAALTGVLLVGCRPAGPDTAMQYAIGTATAAAGALQSTASQAPSGTVSLSPESTSEPSHTLTPAPSDTLSPTVSHTPRPTLTSTPTFGPSPTPTQSATLTRIPTRTRIPSRTRVPTSTPTITPTPTPPSALLRISRPGWMSKVSSPFRMEGVIKAGDDGYVMLQIVGEDGRLIAEQNLDYRYYLNRRLAITANVEFEIGAAAETARLVMSTRDLFGRPIALYSVDVLLMQVGDDEITPPIVVKDPYLVRYPEAEAELSGGTLVVVGLARPVNDSPIIFELIDEHNRVVGSAETYVPPPQGDLSHTPFQVGIPYEVQGSTPVRLVIRQESVNRIPGTVALWSMLLTVAP
jgi:hypothetical protein